MQYSSSGELRIELRYTDITYEILKPAPNPIQIENEIKGTEVALDGAGYLTVFDVLFPKYKHPNDGSLIVWLLLKGAHTLYNPDGGIEMLLLPLVQQQGNALLVSNDNQDNLTARFSKSVYKIVPGESSVQIFTVFTLIILVWCLALLAMACYSRVPEVSVFP